MSQGARRLRKVALSALHYSGADSVIAPFTRGVGAILTLHHVAPDKPGAFEPNRDLKVTPEFIVQVIQQVRAAGFEIVSLDEAHFRLVEGEYGRPFVCFAFDDGYRDLIEHAYPIFQRYDLPFAFYVATDYPGGHGELWWLALERVIIKVGALDVKIDGSQRRLQVRLVGGEGGELPEALWLAADRSTRTTRARSCASCARASTSISPGSARI